MNQFDASETEALKFYVYVYSDPRNGKPFYIGKGIGNRAFAHLKDGSETAKVARIREIQAEGHEPEIEILAFGLDETTAFKVEAAVIDLIGFDNLTNRVVGHGAKKFGRMSVDEVHGKLASRPLESFLHDCVLIRINDTWAESSKQSALELYDATRGSWKVGLSSVSKVNYALAVYAGVVREVYEIAKWLPAESTMYANPERPEPPTDRLEFVGKIAPDEIRQLYRWKSVAHFYRPGAANPIMYVGPHRKPTPAVDDAPPAAATPPSTDTAVVAARSAYPDYLAIAAYICQPDRYFSDGITHLGFYSEGEIKPHVAQILYSEESVLFTRDEAATRLASVHANVRRVGELIAANLDADTRAEGEPYKIMLLSPADDPLTTVLPHPIKNDKVTTTGRAWGWTLSQRYTSLAALLRAPAFTSQLDTVDDSDE